MEQQLSRFARRVLFSFRLRGPLADDSRARMLHGLLVLLAIWLAVVYFSTLKAAPISFPRVFNACLLAVSLLTALLLLRLGHLRIASLVHLWGIWIWATLIFLFFGGIRGLGPTFYVTLPISAAWLLGYRAALRTAAGCLVTALAFTIFEFRGGTLPYNLRPTVFGAWGVLVQATLVGAIPVGQVISRLLATLAERNRAEEDLRKKEHLLSQSQAVAHVGSWSLDPITLRIVWTDETYAIFGVSPDMFTPSVESLIGLIHPEDRLSMQEWIDATAAGRAPGILEFRAVRPDGSIRRLSGQGEMIFSDDTHTSVVVGTAQDITERKRAEEERAKLHAQLVQSQKMESIGRLAGGIAHDFSNLMSVILLHDDQALGEVSSGDPLIEPLTEIRKAAERAVAMTRQLMAFSRKRMLHPEVLNLNSVIVEFEKLVRPIIGEDIHLLFVPGSGLGMVKVDRGELGQIIMNLVVNSRDAMPQGGTLTIETAGIEVDEADARATPAAEPGSYIRVAVRDTGIGMDRETQARIFEPFFTTKDVGKGTGLGLSMVYGIVKQSGGFIKIHSEEGRGTEFNIYLPKVLETAEPAVVAELAPAPRGTERILVVEDEPALREPVRRLLEGAGYQVLVGKDVDEALQIATQHNGALDLLLTDVVMPRMSGPQLAEHLQPFCPQMKVLYMSGYPEPRQSDSRAASEVDIIRKPFTKQQLLGRLREVLEGRKPLDVAAENGSGAPQS